MQESAPFAETRSDYLVHLTKQGYARVSCATTTACHLLKAGVDINTIRAWLGHVSLDTTNVYAEIDLDMKSKALATCQINGLKTKPWREDVGLMAFLKSL